MTNPAFFGQAAAFRLETNRQGSASESVASTSTKQASKASRVSGHRFVEILRGCVGRANVFEDAPLAAILSR